MGVTTFSVILNYLLEKKAFHLQILESTRLEEPGEVSIDLEIAIIT